MSFLRLATVLVHFLWQGALICAVYAAIRNLTGLVCTPAARYGLACCGLAALATAPLATYGFLALREAEPTVMAVPDSMVSSNAAAQGAYWLKHSSDSSGIVWPGAGAQWIVVIWLAGMSALLIRLAGGWAVLWRVRKQTLRQAPFEWQLRFETLRRQMQIMLPVRLFVTPAVEVPVAIGWLRPLVLFPVGVMTGMEPELVAALLAHELAHVGRRDYLVNLLQNVAEAALFYHPAVWWISSHIRQERELCCDDRAVAIQGDAVVYARALAELETCRVSSLWPAMAANGGSLISRIARLVDGKRGVAAPSRRGGWIVILLLIAGGVILAQRSDSGPGAVNAPSLPAFEVASIKPSDPDSALRIEFARGGSLLVQHATLQFLIKIAYDVSDDQIIGGPGWISSTRFDIQAKPDRAIAGDPEKMTKDELLLFHEPVRLRLQRLLAERFRLELRKDSKPLPIFALVADRTGPKMRLDNSVGDPVMGQNAGKGALRATRVDMDTLARFLGEGQTGRPVVNMTGLSGKFDFNLDWTPDPGLNLAPDTAQQPAADGGGLSIFTAVRQQLGLRLEARTGSAETLVVERADLPSGN